MYSTDEDDRLENSELDMEKGIKFIKVCKNGHVDCCICLLVITIHSVLLMQHRCHHFNARVGDDIISDNRVQNKKCGKNQGKMLGLFFPKKGDFVF